MTTLTSPDRLRWLSGEVGHWRDAGLVDDTQASAILAGYRAGHRLRLTRLLLTLGACFVGVGLIWLVAANLDGLTPGVRFAGVTAVWLAFLAGGEALADQPVPTPLVGTLRLLAALTFGGVVFQAAQSLQVPAYDATLVGVWALGALLHAYLRGAVAPLVVGVTTGTTWLLWATGEQAGDATVLVLAAVGAAALGVAALHARWSPAFAPAWRTAGVMVGLLALGGAALPGVGTTLDVGGAVLAVVVAGAAIALAGVAGGRGDTRGEPLLGLAVLGATALLLAYQAESLGNGLLRVALFVAATLAVTVLGTVREEGWLTVVAAVGLVVFTTLQSFSVFADIVDGAWLFLLIGAVLVGTGWLFDRTRRELASVLAEDTAPGSVR